MKTVLYALGITIGILLLLSIAGLIQFYIYKKRNEKIIKKYKQ